MEGRGPAKGNTEPAKRAPDSEPDTARPVRSERVRQAARRDRKAKFTALLHHVTVDRLRDAYLALEAQAAAGVDGVTWEQYGEGSEGTPPDLHGRLHRGAYRAKPSRRVYIPKPDGRQRPLGIAALEDKIVQRAVVEVLNAIYEEDFLGFSYGFRPGRSQHHALDALAIGIMRKKVNWVLDADIRGFFDTIDHGWLVKFIEHRIADSRILRLVQKWLTAGVLEEGKWTAHGGGYTAGSDGLAAARERVPALRVRPVGPAVEEALGARRGRRRPLCRRLRGGFPARARRRVRFRADLRERLQKFGLELHPDKTRLIRFGRYAAERRASAG